MLKVYSYLPIMLKISLALCHHDSQGSTLYNFTLPALLDVMCLCDCSIRIFWSNCDKVRN